MNSKKTEKSQSSDINNSGGRRKALRSARRIVVKVGTTTLTYGNGKLNLTRIDKLARVLSDLENTGREMILVTSGAIGAGVSKLKLPNRPETIREKQAVAAVGQCELMHIYSKFFAEYDHIVAQLLLTRDVVEDGEKRINVTNTFETLLEKGIIPIVNENDTISTYEIMIGQTDTFSENDTLSAVVAKLVKADLLVILSDIDGLYDTDPKKNKDSKLISIVEKITPAIEKCAGGAGSKAGTGGMETKLLAAKIATDAGVSMAIINGSDPASILDLLDGKETGTLFLPEII